MALTEEQSNQIKEQLLKQLSNFPEEKQSEIREQVETMTSDQLENFVKQNKLNHLSGECIFCSIASGQTPSYRIGENEGNIAILELNPLSKGHTLIVPTDHNSNLESSTEELAKEITTKLREKFSPKAIESNKIKVMDHQLIELIPIYGGETERKKATEEELTTLQNEILNVEETEEEVPDLIEPETELFKMPPRIPR